MDSISASPSSCACPCHSGVRASAQSQKSVQLRPASGGHAQLHPWDAKNCPRTRSSRARLRCVAVSGVENGKGAPEAEARNEANEPTMTNSISSVITGRPSGPAANCAVTRRAPLAAEATRISVPPSARRALWSWTAAASAPSELGAVQGTMYAVRAAVALALSDCRHPSSLGAHARGAIETPDTALALPPCIPAPPDTTPLDTAPSDGAAVGGGGGVIK